MQVATLVQADWLFLLTDVPNLFTANPNTDPTAQPIYEVADLSKLHVSSRCQALRAFQLRSLQPVPCMCVMAALAALALWRRAWRPTPRPPHMPTRRWTPARAARSGAPAAWPPS